MIGLVHAVLCAEALQPRVHLSSQEFREVGTNEPSRKQEIGVSVVRSIAQCQPCQLGRSPEPTGSIGVPWQHWGPLPTLSSPDQPAVFLLPFLGSWVASVQAAPCGRHPLSISHLAGSATDPGA